jgi:4-hydroxy-tetrahydrodipicolinate reductase
MPIRIAILGAAGKMGQRILELASCDPEFDIVSLVNRENATDLLNALSACDVGIDFTSHLATTHNCHAALLANKPLVIGTTGHTPEEKEVIAEAAKTIPILYSPNFSFGIALCSEAVSRFANALGSKCKIDIVETHHIHKKDSPSGTALALAHAAERGEKEIAIQSIRTGDVIGEHAVIFECGHEKIEIKHTAHSRDAFATGALIAAKFLVNQTAGLYSLRDLFKDDANKSTVV